MNPKVINVVIGGLGGQGVIRASDVLADAAVRAGFDVKKSELHGMSQRGGSVSSDVRFGPQVLSPMVPAGEADFLVILAEDQVETNRHVLKPGGDLLTPSQIPLDKLPVKKGLNVALLGKLSLKLPQIAPEHWRAALKACFPEKLHASNEKTFALGRGE
ncbi:MAG: 2-oxoacid:acceptor oxidoreductase family protein [Opitutaceae bacterium]|jgi:indolepyruvate ferredoxin oxidoreductase beta subunit|nr:2-oxoacid:acceptor oxidoreductase family protein [Opitutaceae bacterium]